MMSARASAVAVMALFVPVAVAAQPPHAPARTTASAQIQASATPSSAEDRSYVLGPEDVIQVAVLGQDYSAKGRIGEDGKILLPYIGEVAAIGKTPRQLEEEVARALKSGGFFTRPIVSVDILGFASRNVTVLGSVATPGVVPIDRPYRLSEIIARVGGPRDDGADYVVVRPENGPEKRYTIKDLAEGDATQDPYVAPGEKIFVPKAEIFYVSGQVRAPGAYALTPGLTLRSAIARGGGLTEQGSEGRVKVTRNGKPEHLTLESAIAPGDVIVVGQRLF